MYTLEQRTELMGKIFDLIEEGQSARVAVNLVGIGRSTFLDWSKQQEFASRYARACEARAELLFDEILKIADDETEDVQKSKLKIDARKWTLAKMLPKRYGDRVDLSSTGQAEPMGATIIVNGVSP